MTDVKVQLSNLGFMREKKRIAFQSFRNYFLYITLNQTSNECGNGDLWCVGNIVAFLYHKVYEKNVNCNKFPYVFVRSNSKKINLVYI